MPGGQTKESLIWKQSEKTDFFVLTYLKPFISAWFLDVSFTHDVTAGLFLLSIASLFFFVLLNGVIAVYVIWSGFCWPLLLIYLIQGINTLKQHPAATFVVQRPICCSISISITTLPLTRVLTNKKQTKQSERRRRRRRRGRFIYSAHFIQWATQCASQEGMMKGWHIFVGQPVSWYCTGSLGIKLLELQIITQLIQKTHKHRDH